MLGNATVAAVVATTDLERARAFYGGMLGLSASAAAVPDGAGEVVYACGGGTTLVVYQRATAGDSEATCANFRVEDVPDTVQRLRGKGVVFEEFDMEGAENENGVLTMDGFQAAWFKDPDGNMLAVTN